MTSKTKQATEAATDFDKTIGRVQRTFVAFAAIYAATKLSSLFVDAIKSGVDFNSQIETAKIGIASLFVSQMNFKDSWSGQITGVERLNAALKLSDEQVAKLRYDNLQTAATFTQLAKAYQLALAPGLQVGFSPEQVRKYSLRMTQAAGAIGMPMDYMGEEMRSLLKGTITPRNTLIATYLGITNEDIAKHKGNATDLFNFIMGKLSAFGEKSNTYVLLARVRRTLLPTCVNVPCASPQVLSVPNTHEGFPVTIRLRGVSPLFPQSQLHLKPLILFISAINAPTVLPHDLFRFISVIKALTSINKL